MPSSSGPGNMYTVPKHLTLENSSFRSKYTHRFLLTRKFANSPVTTILGYAYSSVWFKSATKSLTPRINSCESLLNDVVTTRTPTRYSLVIQIISRWHLQNRIYHPVHDGRWNAHGCRHTTGHQHGRHQCLVHTHAARQHTYQPCKIRDGVRQYHRPYVNPV